MSVNIEMQPKKYTRLKQSVFSHLSQVKKSLFFAVVCMLGFTLTELIAPWPIKIIFDHVLLEKPLPVFLSFFGGILLQRKVLFLVVVSLAIIFNALLRGLFSYFQLFITSQVGYRLVSILRVELFAHLQGLSLSFHNRARTGELMTKVSGDTNTLRDVFAEWSLTFIAHLLTVIGMLIVMTLMNWKLSLIVLSTFPLLFYALFSLYGKIKVSVKRQRRREGKIAARIAEALTSILLVQAFGRQRYEEERFGAESALSLKESIRTARMEAVAGRTVEILSAAGICAAVFFGALEVLKKAMTPGDLLVFTSYLANMYKPIRSLAKLSTKFSKAAVSVQRINEILETEPEIQDHPQAIIASHLKGGIVFQDVSFGYREGQDVLKGVSFSILPGQKVALVGASGAGKSTIINLLLRLYDPRRGVILIDGVDIKRYQQDSLRREIGIVLQDSLLFGATIRENISYGKLEAGQEELEEAARAARAHDFISGLADGYDTLIGERGATLSGGERQRISLARAIIKHPSILVLDEPTSAVDAESARFIQEALEHFMEGRTSIVIVHRFSSIKMFDQIMVLRSGEVVERGTHGELLELKGYYYELFKLQEI